MRHPRIILWLTLSSCLHASPSGTNLGFENGLTGWSHSGVSIESSDAYEGNNSLKLHSGWIEQSITGLTPSSPHVLQIAYQDETPESYIQGHARILVDGTTLTELHNGQDNEFLDGIGFAFTPQSSSATLRIEALPGDSETFLIDDIRIFVGTLPAPPSESWSNLTVINDARGGRRLMNGNFETEPADPDSDPYNSGSDGADHLSRFSLPGWLVTQENVDIVHVANSNAPEGNFTLDLGGHGPGGIEQTITGLEPGTVYTLSFYYASHAVWLFSESDIQTGELKANGVLVDTLSRNYFQSWNSDYEIYSIPLLSSDAGELTIHLRSTVTDRGGSSNIDDLRLSEGGDAFLAWTQANQISSDPDGNADGDPFTQEFEFLLDQNPKAPDPNFIPKTDGLSRVFEIPLNGTALGQGYTLDLQASTTLGGWTDASNLGVTLDSDSSSPGTDGVRRYVLPANTPRLFLRLVLGRP